MCCLHRHWLWCCFLPLVIGLIWQLTIYMHSDFPLLFFQSNGSLVGGTAWHQKAERWHSCWQSPFLFYPKSFAYLPRQGTFICIQTYFKSIYVQWECSPYVYICHISFQQVRVCSSLICWKVFAYLKCLPGASVSLILAIKHKISC